MYVERERKFYLPKSKVGTSTWHPKNPIPKVGGLSTKLNTHPLPSTTRQPTTPRLSINSHDTPTTPNPVGGLATFPHHPLTRVRFPVTKVVTPAYPWSRASSHLTLPYARMVYPRILVRRRRDGQNIFSGMVLKYHPGFSLSGRRRGLRSVPFLMMLDSDNTHY